MVAAAIGSKVLRHLPLLIGVLVAGLAYRLLNLPGDYPFYAYWDMDQVTAVDLLLLNSGHMPDHIHHPGGAMYWLQNSLLTLYHQFGWISVRTLDGLAAAVNPVGAMAELIDQLRRWSAWISLGTILWLWLAVTRVRRLPTWLRYAFLLVLASAPFASYHSSLIRTDTYAAFFWSLALWLAIRAATEQGWRRQSLMLAHGLAQGLALFAKLQVLLLLPIPYLLARLVARPVPNVSRWPSAGLWLALPALLLPLPAVIALPILEQGGAFLYGAQFGPNPIFFATLVGGILLLALHFSLPLWRSLTDDLGQILTGFVVAPWLVCLAAPAWPERWLYLLHLYKIVFWRPFPVQDFQLGLDLLRFDWPVSVFMAAALAIYLRSLRGGSATMANTQHRWLRPEGLAGLVLLLVLLQVAVGSRPIVRDMIWLETAGLSCSAILLALAWPAARQQARRWLMLALLTVAGGNLYLSFAMPGQIAAVYNHYTYDPSRILFAVLNGNNTFYTQAIGQRLQLNSQLTAVPTLPKALNRPVLQEPARSAVLQAINHQAQRRLVTELLPGSFLDWTSIGNSTPGLPVWKGSAARFDWVPPAFVGATSVDLSDPGGQTRRAYRLDRNIQDAESLDYFTWKSTTQVTVMPRNDYSTFLFLDKADYQALIRKPLAQAYGPLIVSTPQGAAEYYGYFVDRVTAVPVAQLSRKSFLLLVSVAAMHGHPATTPQVGNQAP